MKYPVAERLLGIVVVIDGKFVRGVYALDGTVFETLQVNVTIAESETLETIRSIKEFTLFQLKCVERQTSESQLMSMAPGIQYPLVCWGAGQPKGKETLT